MLLLSLLALVIGSLLCQWLNNNPGTRKTVDGLVMGLMLGLLGTILVMDILPASHYQGLLLAAVGFCLPYLLEKTFHRFARQTHIATLVIGLLGLVLHALLDGAGLIASQHHGDEHTHWLGWAIVLHRLPVGMMTWWLLAPQFGNKIAAASLTAIGIATVVGYGLAGEVLQLDHDQLAWLEALVTGSLLHVILNKRHADKHHH